MSEKGLRGKVIGIVGRHAFYQPERCEEIADQILSAVMEALPVERRSAIMSYGPTLFEDKGWNAYREAAIAAIKGGE